MPNLKTIDETRRDLVATLSAVLHKQLGSDTVYFMTGRRGQGRSMLLAYVLWAEMRRGGTVYTNYELPTAAKETIGKYATIIKLQPGQVTLKGQNG